MALQNEWRFCDKCMVMFFDGYASKGHCAAGGGHQASGFDFFLPHDVPETPGAQHNWRYCGKCQAMFFDGYPGKGRCPAGGAHLSSGFLFVLPFNRPGTPNAQPNWRYCEKCAGMFFDGYQSKGRCPAGGAHLAAGFNFVLPHDLLVNEGPNRGDPTGSGQHPEPGNDPPPEDGPTQNPDNRLPGEGPGCFIGCTPVLMADGTTRRIDAIAVGDRVKARDEVTGGFDDAFVDQVFRHRVPKTLLLQVEGGEVIGTTAEHRFACDGRGFVSAGQLSPEDTLAAYGGRTSRVVATEPHPAPATVYNLSVARLHTYFIGSAALWVHNVKKTGPVDDPTP